MANHSTKRPAGRMAELLAYEKRRLIRKYDRAWAGYRAWADERGIVGDAGIYEYFIDELGLDEFPPKAPTAADFNAAYEECYDILVKERAWPHFTPERRGWRDAQEAVKLELLRMWLGQPSPFGEFVVAVRAQTDGSRSAGGEMIGTIAG